MTLFDPAREIVKIREHLTSEHPISFLFGAGSSASSIGTDGQPLVPAVAKMTELCKEAACSLGTWAEQVWDGINSACDGSATVEDVLSAIRQKLRALAPGDTSLGATPTQLKQLDEAITATIAQIARPSANRFPVETPQRDFARWVAKFNRAIPLELFTTNYDSLIERGLETERVPLFDGFVGSDEPFFFPASLAHAEAAPGSDWVRLWKIHGSINWRATADPDGSIRVVRDSSADPPHLILPSSDKYDQSRKLPYVALLDRFSRALMRDDALLVTVGFGFGDQHINEIVADSLESNRNFHLMALQFEDPTPSDQIHRLGTSYENAIVYGPTVGIIGRSVGQWKLVEPVTERTAPQIDLAFDSDGVPVGDYPATSGKFKLGDFNWFARYLTEITSDVDA